MDLTPHDARPEDARQATTLAGSPQPATPGPGPAGPPIPGPGPAGPPIPGPGPAGPDDLGAPPPITPEELAEKLDDLGKMLNRLHHPASDLWLWTDQELAAISGPGARELNKRGASVRAVLTRLDLVAVLFGLLGYLSRQLEAWRATRDTEDTDTEDTDTEDPEPDHRGPEGFGIGDVTP